MIAYVNLISACLMSQIAAERLAGLNPRLYNFQVGNFAYVDEELHWGQLQGRLLPLLCPLPTPSTPSLHDPQRPETPLPSSPPVLQTTICHINKIAVQLCLATST